MAEERDDVDVKITDLDGHLGAVTGTISDFGRHLGVLAGAARAAPRLRPEFRSVVRLAFRYDAGAGRVFDAWIEPAIAAQWLFATAGCAHASTSIDARVGGAFRFESRRCGEAVAYRGEYRELVRGRRLVFLLALGGSVMTRVCVAIAPQRRGCLLRLSHAGVPAAQSARIACRWTGVLHGLHCVLGCACEPVP